MITPLNCWNVWFASIFSQTNFYKCRKCVSIHIKSYYHELLIKKIIVFYLVCLLKTSNLKCILKKEPEKAGHPCQTSNTCFNIKHQLVDVFWERVKNPKEFPINKHLCYFVYNTEIQISAFEITALWLIMIYYTDIRIYITIKPSTCIHVHDKS